MLSDNLGRWDGVGGRFQEGGDRYVPVADSCSCMAETNSNCKAIILQLKIIKKKTDEQST